MIVFDHIGKTAGTTLKFILRNSFGICHCDVKHAKRNPFTSDELAFARKVFPDIKCISGHALVNPVENIRDEDCFFITVLREPVIRCISNYQDDCLRRAYTGDLKEWLSDSKTQNLQVKQIAGQDNLAKAKELLDEFSFVGLTERFDESMKLLKLISPYPLNINYKKKIVASDNTIKNEILNNKEKYELVRNHNLLDIELYRYVKDELFPARLEEKKRSWKILHLLLTCIKMNLP